MKNENIYFDYDVSSEQKRIYIFEKLNGNTIIYNMPSIVKLNNKIDFNHIQSVINKITDRQQSLRTSFHMVNGKLFQRVHSKIEPKIKMYSLSGYNSASDIMEEFVCSLPQPMQNKLSQAISGRGAFRRFKNTIRQLGIEEQWYEYQASAYRRKAIEWCKENQLVFEE